MSSLTKITETKRRSKRCKAGRKRKNKLGKKSTASYVELFAVLDSPSPAQKSA